MKKFFLFALLSVFSFTAFAEIYDYKTSIKIRNEKGMDAFYDYVLNSEPNTAITEILPQVNVFMNYQKEKLGKVNLSKQQALQLVKPYLDACKNNEIAKDIVRFAALQRAGYYDDEVYELAKKITQNKAVILQYLQGAVFFKKLDVNKAIDMALQNEAIYLAFDFAVKAKNKEKVWELGELILSQGECKSPQVALNVLNKMFGLKPRSINKTKQIQFLDHLSEYYPVPGTDFTQWKGFMGFLGYKYKALTGKDLFPESK